ncbi:MAG TPA: hypothetical protein PKC25_02435, partial [Candidatus Rifleibacterium sp.]|nr:hypothetical protein [Candidatus Rifleibacterium sp.]
MYRHTQVGKTGRENMKITGRNKNFRLVAVWPLVLLFFCLVFSNQAIALNQLANSFFDADGSSWDVQQRIATTIPLTVNPTDNMSGWSWFDFAGNGCYYIYRLSNRNRLFDAFVSQNFSTPAEPINIRIRFDHREEYGTLTAYRLHGSIRNAGGTYPNETVANAFFNEAAPVPAHETAWQSNTYDIALPTGVANYIFRVMVYFNNVQGSRAGVFLDNLTVNFSPSGLTGSTSGNSNLLSWNVSSSANATLNSTTPYRIYRSTTSGTYGAPLDTSNINSYTDNSPPAGTIVYYCVSDLDDEATPNESAKSVELPVLRMTVNDGAGADVDTIAGDDVTMNWVNNVGAVGPTGYEVALGTSPGASDIVGWTAVAVGDTSYTFTGQTLTNGTTYYCSIRVVTATRTLNSSSSDGFVSINTVVRDGSGVDVDVTSSLSDADMNWDALTIPVLRYEVALGTTP